MDGCLGHGVMVSKPIPNRHDQQFLYIIVRSVWRALQILQ